MKIFEFLDGREYVLDGIHGTFRHNRSGIYSRLEHVPSLSGKRNLRYQETKRELGDDWITDFTSCINRYCGIAVELGYGKTAIFRYELITSGCSFYLPELPESITPALAKLLRAVPEHMHDLNEDGRLREALRWIAADYGYVLNVPECRNRDISCTEFAARIADYCGMEEPRSKYAFDLLMALPANFDKAIAPLPQAPSDQIELPDVIVGGERVKAGCYRNLEPVATAVLSTVEATTLMAALRYLQERVPFAQRHEIFSDSTFQPLTDQEIDELLNKLNGYGT